MTIDRRMKTVLFACIHNAGRSQMAGALFNALADPARARATPAGTEPADRVHPEVGIDLGRARPQRLAAALAAEADLLVTMGCGEACPVVPGLPREDWPVDDPQGQPYARVREIREGIRARVERPMAREGWAQKKYQTAAW